VEGGDLHTALAAAGLTRERVIGWADEIQVGLLGQVRRRWRRGGVRIRQRLQRQRTYRSLFLAVDVRTGQLWYCWLGSMKGEEFCGVVRGIEQAGVLDAVVWDGAPGHRDERVGRIGVPLIPLPPYSPELNPAERLFEAIRAEIEGEVYVDLDDKCARVQAILARWDAHPDQVQALVGWHWILDVLEQLPALSTT
jgi:DDE superfamily endonuclease